MDKELKMNQLSNQADTTMEDHDPPTPPTKPAESASGPKVQPSNTLVGFDMLANGSSVATAMARAAAVPPEDLERLRAAIFRSEPATSRAPAPDPLPQTEQSPTEPVMPPAQTSHAYLGHPQTNGGVQMATGPVYTQGGIRVSPSVTLHYGPRINSSGPHELALRQTRGSVPAVYLGGVRQARPTPQGTVTGGVAMSAAVPLMDMKPPALELDNEQRLLPGTRTAQRARKLVVSSYRIIGFFILLVIVLGLISYLASSLFFFVSRSWVAPTVIASTDQRVLTLKAKQAESESIRDKLRAEIKHLDRFIKLQEGFQQSFRLAVKADLQDREARLTQLRHLRRRYAQARNKIRRSGDAFGKLSGQRMKEHFDAHLIDNDGLISGKYKLAQITSAKLSLAESEAELKERAHELEREASALSATLKGEGNAGNQLSYEVLQIKRDYERSLLQTAKARDSRKALHKSVNRYDKMIAEVANSPYLQAASSGGTMGFLPYENLQGLDPGTALYGCRINNMLWCKQVGEVVAVLDGEVKAKHPFHNEQLRGQMVELKMYHAHDAERPVLFAGGPPLLL